MYYIGYPKGPGHTTVVSEYLFRPETSPIPPCSSRSRSSSSGT